MGVCESTVERIRHTKHIVVFQRSLTVQLIFALKTAVGSD